MAELVELLNTNPSITSVNLYHNNICNDGAFELAKLKYVRDLNLRYNNINDNSIEPLAKSSIHKLNLCKTGITDKGGAILASCANQISIILNETKVSD